MKKRGKLLFSAILFAISAIALGCGAKEPVDAGKLKQVYFINKAETKVEMHEYVLQSEGAEEQLAELIEQLKTIPKKLEYKAPLEMGFELNSYRMDGDTLYLDVNEAYRNLSPTTEVLVRAALVRTLTQAPGVKYVSMTVEGGQLHDSLDNVVGLMTADQFVDNAGAEINAYERVRLKLYFANEDGTALIPVNRTIAYNTNISMEKLVVEQLLQGPGQDVSGKAFPTINPNTRIVSVAVKDGICYVNFDETFLTQIYTVSTDVSIYSIVNSLAELKQVNKVQISVNGETNLLYRESVSLETVFERNLDLITTAE